MKMKNNKKKKKKNMINSNENNLVEKYRVKKIKNYKSEGSFAKIKINKPKCIFSFVPDDIVVIISSDEKLIFSKIEKKRRILHYY